MSEGGVSFSTGGDCSVRVIGSIVIDGKLTVEIIGEIFSSSLPAHQAIGRIGVVSSIVIGMIGVFDSKDP
jgi:hypothetical protein